MSGGTSPDYLLIGHMTADLTPDGRTPGGTVSYAARTAAAFGVKVGVVTSAAADEPLLHALTPYADMISLPASHTTTYENVYLPTGRVQYVREVAARINAVSVPAHWRRTPFTHLAPIADEVDPAVAALFPDSMVLLTLQGWLRHWDENGRVHFKRWFDPHVLRHVQIVVFSEEDIIEAPDMEAAFAQVVEHVVVTRAERGGTYYHRGVAHAYASPQVEMVHPTGAGDIFAAALLASLPLVQHDFHRAVAVAAQIAAISVTRRGLDSAPTHVEVQFALAQAAAHPVKR